MSVGRGRSAEITERVLRVYLRTVLSLTATLLAVFVLLYLLWLTRQIIVWLLIAIFLAVALDPLVAFFQRHGLPRRGLAVLAALLVVLAAIVAIALAILPPLVAPDRRPRRRHPRLRRRPHQRTRAARLPAARLPDRRSRAGADRGRRLGCLVTDLAGGAVQVAATVVSTIVALVTILVMVVFLLLGGPRWVEQFTEALSVEQRDRFERVGGDLYRSVGGYVRGNLAISVSRASRRRSCCSRSASPTRWRWR